MDKVIFSEKKAKCFVNNNWLYFTISLEKYDNFVVFFDVNDISIIKTLNIDFTKIPLNLHGYGYSKTLLEYLSNNYDDDELIMSFIDYFIKLLDFRYIDNNKINITFTKGVSWKDSNIIVPYNIVNTILTADLTLVSVDNIGITVDETTYSK